MPKRKRSKLTAKLKDFLYNNRNKVKLSDYSGDALAYLIRLRAASKAKKTRQGKIAKIGDTTIPRNTELYRVIERAAKIKKITVKQFIKKYKTEVNELLQDGKVVLSRETSYAIKDIEKLPRGSKVFINDQEVSKGDAVYAVQNLTASAMRHTSTAVINYEMSYDLEGNLYLTLPTDEEIEELEEMEDEGEAYDEFLDDQEGISVVKSPRK